MSKTVHVILENGQWAVKCEGGTVTRVFSTQREAVKSAKGIVKAKQPGQLVVHGRDGRIREYDAYGLPPIQDPPGKKSTRITKAVSKITRQRLDADPLPSRG